MLTHEELIRDSHQTGSATTAIDSLVWFPTREGNEKMRQPPLLVRWNVMRPKSSDETEMSDVRAISFVKSGDTDLTLQDSSVKSFRDWVRPTRRVAIVDRARLPRSLQRLVIDDIIETHTSEITTQQLELAANLPGLSAPRPPASLVITVKNDYRALAKLLPAIRSQMSKKDELIIVDGGSTDTTDELLKAVSATDSRLRYKIASGVNIPKGRNLAISMARHDVIVCTDAGCMPHQGWLDGLARGCNSESELDLVTGIYKAGGASFLERAQALSCYPWPREALKPTILSRAYGMALGLTWDPSLPTGRSMAFRKSAWSRVGGFPENLPAGEDVRFGRAVRDAGLKVGLRGDAIVEWAQRPTLRSTARMYYSYTVHGAQNRMDLLVARNLLRALAYPIGVILVLRRNTRPVAAIGALIYYSLPIQRARRSSQLKLIPAIPFAMAIKDLSQAVGTLAGLKRKVRP